MKKLLKFLMIATFLLAPLPNVNAAGWLPLATGSTFTPASLPNLLVWWKADAGVTGSAPVTAWADQSGNGYNLAEASAGPAFSATGLNGHPTLTFTAATPTRLSTATGVAIGTGSASSCFWVGTYTTSTASFGRGISYAPSGGNDTDTGATIYAIRDGANNNINAFNSGNPATPVAITPSTVVHMGVVFNGTAVTPYKGGVSQGTGTLASTTVNVSGGLFIIGTQISGGVAAAVAWDGTISEIVCTNDAMTSGNITSLETYFARWN